MKEQLEYATAEDTDGLIAELHDLNERMARLRIVLDVPDKDYVNGIKRRVKRLNDKRTDLLRVLKQSLEYLDADL